MLSSLYKRLRSNKWNEIIIMGVRFLVGLAFIPSGIVKLAGERFTSLGLDNPVGYFFDALYRTGLYWNFLGLCQLITALLLFTQRFATLGALMLSGIILNIFVITVSLHFSGTWVVTGLMLFAATVLLIWDWYKLKSIFGFYPTESEIKKFREPSLAWQIAGLIAFTLITTVVLMQKQKI